MSQLDPHTPDPSSLESIAVNVANRARFQIPSDGSQPLSWPCAIEKITHLSLHDLGETQKDLRKILPGFPNEMTKLDSLFIHLSPGLLENPKSGYTLEGAFPSSLKYLELDRIPLYEPISAITTLTHFILHNKEFAQPLDVLLDFLEQNRSLERVKLTIGFPDPSHRHSVKADPIRLEQLKRLEVNGIHEADNEALKQKLDPVGVEVVWEVVVEAQEL